MGDGLDQQVSLRQILVVTDGCSNVGGDPVESATRARRQNIVVNVIGVVDKGDMGRQGRKEAESIAQAGGGMCRIVQPMDLSATAQMVTHQTMSLTLQQVVNRELLQMMGKSTEDLPPHERASLMQVVDKLEEELNLELVVAVDTSASMREKLQTVREAIHDLALSLSARVGRAQVAILAFPGQHDAPADVLQPFETKVNVQVVEKLTIARGGTPTGPAIEAAIDLIVTNKQANTPEDSDWTGGKTFAQ